MSAFGEASETEPPSADPVTVRLDEILDELVAVVADTAPVRDAARIDRVARLEKLRAATAALQTAESVRFAQSQVAEQLAANVRPDAIGRGLADKSGLPAASPQWSRTRFGKCPDGTSPSPPIHHDGQDD
jgi:hypothetical protein